MSDPSAGRVRIGPALPMRLAEGAAAPFFGRSNELTVLREQLALAERGERQVVLLTGDAGIGKTSLAAVVSGEGYDLGATVLYARCEEDRGVPYQPFVDALRHYVARTSDAALAAQISRFGGELSRLLPELVDRIADCAPSRLGVPEAERLATFRAVNEFLLTMSSEALVILVLDDLHWADRGTLQLLRAVCTNVESSRLLVLATYRASEMDQKHPLQAAIDSLTRHEGVTRVPVEGLSHEEVASLVEAVLTMTPDDASVPFIHSLTVGTGGNPFFVREILRHLEESGSMTTDAQGHWSLSGSLEGTDAPRSVREVVDRRVARLGPVAQEVLSAASVLGRDFDLVLLCSMTGRNEGEVLSILELAVRSNLVAESTTSLDRYSFAHAIVQQSTYNQMTPASRRMQHSHVASILSYPSPQDGARAAEIAHHWLLSDSPAAALPFAHQAGRVATSMVAPEEAIEWFGRALELQEAYLPDDLNLHCDLLIDLGVAQKLSGDAAHRQTLLDACAAAEQSNDARRMAQAALANYRGFWTAVGQIDEEKVAALERAIAMQPGGDSLALSELTAIYCNEITFTESLARRRELADQALSMAELQGDPMTLVRVINALFQPLLVPEYLHERLDNSSRAVELARGLDDAIAVFTSLVFRMRTCFEAGLTAEARSILEELTIRAEALIHPYPKWFVEFTRATIALLEGNPDEAERCAGVALDLGTEAGQPDAFAIYVVCLHSVRWQQGRLAEVLGVIEQAVADAPSIPGYRAAIARAMLDAGRADEARAMLREAWQQGFEHLPRDLTWSTVLAVYGEVAVRLGEADVARSVLALLAPWTDRMTYVAAAIDGPIATTAGALATMLGDYEKASTWFEQAATMHGAAEATFFWCRNQVERSAMLFRRGVTGDRPTAARMLDEADVIARENDYQGLRRRITEIREQSP